MANSPALVIIAPMFSFVGDDFTGSTDAMEILSLAGVRTVLFTTPPSKDTLARHPDIQAFGVATNARSQSPDQMSRTLRPVFEAIKLLSPSICHYKVCSTFDSSPTIGSIGKAMEIGCDVFGSPLVPIVAGAPSLGRYCVFSQLFARYPGDGNIHRIDRHPSMSKHPITPMDEADLRLHLAKQTSTQIHSCQLPELEAMRGREDASASAWRKERRGAMLLDVINDSHLVSIGRLLESLCEPPGTLFAVGSSGVESAFVASRAPGTFSRPDDSSPSRQAKPICVIAGSCSPVTAAQIQYAAANGFVDVQIDQPIRLAEDAIRSGKNVIIHSNASHRLQGAGKTEIGPKLAGHLIHLLSLTGIRRVIIAGGDTSGEIAHALRIQSMQMLAPLVRGAPLVKVHADFAPADGLEMCFKGGQVGPADFFATTAAMP